MLSKYNMDEVKIEDQGLARYINTETEKSIPVESTATNFLENRKYQ